MVDPTEPSDPQPVRERDLPPRYRVLEQIGAGGQGVVFLVRDTRLDREVVLKVLSGAERAGEGAAHARWVEHEIRVTTRLQHRGIVAVYDAGQLADGRRWYAMRRVRGQQLDVWTDDLRDARRAVRPDALRPVVHVLATVCHTVAYAHQEGFTHCDLKPANIMVESADDVQVIDWGAARPIGDSAAVGSVDDVHLQPSGRAVTLMEVALGTPHYMAPERVKAEAQLTPAVDVYALGVMLYELLAGRLPYLCSPHEVLRRLPHEAPAPLSLLVQPVDRDHGDLIAIAEQATHRSPTARQTDCAVLASQLTDWLRMWDKRREADAIVRHCSAQAATLAQLHRSVARKRREIATASEGIEPHCPVDDKLAVWALEDALRALKQAIRRDRLLLEQLLHTALSRDREHPSAHRLLAGLYRAMAEEAEHAGKRDEADALARRVEDHDQGEQREWCAGLGRVSILTEPVGVRVRARRLRELRRRLTPDGPPVDLGQTPLDNHPLVRGSWLVELVHSAGVVHYPIHVTRASHWQDRYRARPVTAVAVTASVSPEACHVPGGWFHSGGDHCAPDSLPGAHRWADAFVIERFPVTCSRYLAFLNAVARTNVDAARRHCPRAIAANAGTDAATLLFPEAGGRFRLPDDPRFHPSAPVTLVDWRSASAFAVWRADRTGQPWRLPTGLEWEKAARGVDGRQFPWGQHPVPTYANMLRAHADEPTISTVESYPTDESVYGVRGMAGNVRDWCNDWYTRLPLSDRADEVPVTGRFRNVRGGSYVCEARWCRTAARLAAGETARLGVVGFRLVRSI